MVLALSLLACDALRWEPTLATGNDDDDSGIVGPPDTGDGVCPEYQGGGVVTWYWDGDEDGWGTDEIWILCDVTPEGYVTPRALDGDWRWDCDDDDPALNPEAEEVCDDGVDQDCDGYDAYERTYYYDQDGDGYWSESGVRACEDSGSGAHISPGNDCDDDDASVNIVAEEVCGDEIDQDCDGEDFEGEVWYLDDDGDGFGSDELGQACEQPENGVADDRDCDDGDASVNPDAEEICGDDLDNDCRDGDDEGPLWYPDADDDSYADLDAGAVACEQPEGWLSGGRDDCDDTDAAVNPGAVEVCGDGVDNDCDGSDDLGDTWFADADGDGWGDILTSSVSCEAPLGYVDNHEDCDDTDASVNPDGEEICGDGLDNDCNDGDDLGDTWYADGDGDGYGDAAFTTESCTEPSGYVDNTEDCDDLDADVNPDALEVCGDGIDNDCDSTAEGCGIVGDFSAYDAEAQWDGESAGDLAGLALTALGDQDGDGVDEVLLGAREEDSQGSNAGAAYVLAYDDVSLTSAHAVLLGDAAADYLGTSVAAGDVDGDGWADVVVGAYGQDEHVSNGGAVYVAHGPLTGQVLVEDSELAVRGTQTNTSLAARLVAVGDQDGDGADDLFVPTYSYDEVWVVAGGSTGELDDSSVEALVSGTAGTNFGFAVAGGQDVDGDGLDDWVVGATYAESYDGVSYLFHGPLSGSLTEVDADASWTGSGAEWSGYTVALVEDDDGDGLADVAIGAVNADVGAANSGSVYVVAGNVEGEGEVADALGSIDGLESGDNLGTRIGRCDLDGDGEAEWLMAAGRSSNQGRVSVFAGPVTGNMRIDVVADGAVTGNDSGDNLESFACPGDWGVDGIGDLVVGAYGADDNGTDAGAVYLFSGGEGL